MKTRAAAVVMALGLAAGACGSTEEPAASAPSGEAGGETFPSVDVVSLNEGSTVNFGSQLAGGDQAILVWFWAPH